MIFVKTLTGRTYTIPVESNTTLAQLEDMVMERLSDPKPSGVRLIFAGQQINRRRGSEPCNHTLRDFKVPFRSTIHMVLSLRGGRTIPIKNTSTGKTIYMDPGIDTISDLKTEIQKVTGIPARQQHLCFDDKELENHRAFREFIRSREPFGEFTLRRSP